MTKETKTDLADILICPKCGANLELSSVDGRETAVCPYCGFSRIIELGMTEEERKQYLRELMYERERARLKAQEEHTALQDARVKRGRRIALAIVLTPIILGLLLGILISIFGDPTKPALDPFEDLTVFFSGPDGKGKAEISGKSGVSYRCENNGELTENGTAVIKASSDDYRLKGKSREYTVTGLDLYITESSMLDGDCIAFLREHTTAALEREFGTTGGYLSSATKHYESWEWEAADVFVISKGRFADRVFDVVELRFTNGDDTVVKYAAYCFENAVRRSGGIAPVSFDREYFYGPVSDIGALGAGSNPVWGTYMGVMTGYDSLEEFIVSIRADFADWTRIGSVGGE